MKYKIKQIKDAENCEYYLKHYNWVKDKIDLKDYEVVYDKDTRNELNTTIYEITEVEVG